MEEQIKQIIHFLNIIFCPRGQIIIALLLFKVTATAQETPPTEFVLDGYMSYESLFIDSIYNSYIECGFNTMTQRTDNDSKSLLEDFNLHAVNVKNDSDWIYYYSSAYYSKWEAEEDKQSEFEVGVKHSAGQVTTWKGIDCWSTKNLLQPVDTLVYGPTYHQEKWYKRWYMPNVYDLEYTPRFNMALEVKGNVSPDEDVCRIYVLLKYRRKIGNNEDLKDSTYILKEPVTLKVSDFDDNGEFNPIYFSANPLERNYKYPSIFNDPIIYKMQLPLTGDTTRFDTWEGQGVQFCIDWLRSDTICTLYIDNIEVYDNDGWNQYIENSELVVDRITTYAQNFSGWTNIKHWLGGHEPHTIDAYTPIKTVDAILESVGSPSLMNTVWVDWTLKLNGESQLERYYNTVQPKQLLVEHHPVQAAYQVVRPFDLEVLRRILQESHTLTSTQDKKFYYHIQTYGEKKSNVWHVWRQPTTPEYKAMLSLALSHGIDGLVQAQYNSDPETSTHPEMVGLIGREPRYERSDLWYELRDNSIPRLKGTLGKKLLTLNYTGDTLYLGRYLLEDPGNGFTNSGPTMINRYLTLTEYTSETPPTPVHFHAGFFESPNQIANNHFLLTNLITTDSRWVNIKVTDDGSSYLNTRFRNVEPENNFDTTFNNSFSIDMQFPAGEGYLFQVAPVVIYGGKLIYPETISSTTTLLDEMVIQNGAILTVNSTYNVDRDIRIKAGGRITTTNGGTLRFLTGNKLIIEDHATIAGTSQHKLILDFMSPENGNGIVIKQGGSLTISFCEIKNAATGIKSELNVAYLNVRNSDFTNCTNKSINILGFQLSSTTQPTFQVRNCTIQGSDYAITASALNSILIKDNTITNSKLAISILQIPYANILGNNITSNLQQNAGIFFNNSSNGYIRNNSVSGHSVGIYLANYSSPKIGTNELIHNKQNGIYASAGSVPDLRLYLGSSPNPNCPPTFYALSGCNDVKENGGYSQYPFAVGDDGSEIFLGSSFILMDEGYNRVVDDREEEPPLYHTLLLMNGAGVQKRILARYNWWGLTEISPARFGNLTVTYEPTAMDDGCPIPQILSPCSLIVPIVYDTEGAVVEADTLYPLFDAAEISDADGDKAIADGYFLQGDYENAELIYNGIIEDYPDSLQAYYSSQQLFAIKKIQNSGYNDYNALQNFYNNYISSVSDTLLVKMIENLNTLCYIGKEEYETAIGRFEEIINLNQGQEEAIYAEIDLLVTAMLASNDSSGALGKLSKKYALSSNGGYEAAMDKLLGKLGLTGAEDEEEILPTEYTLYQNYPNPFNPTTTIKYDLPNTGDVSLIIYDILGRKVKELVNTKQEAGRYEIQFNASTLASGVYIYQLIAEKYINSKKMILLK